MTGCERCPTGGLCPPCERTTATDIALLVQDYVSLSLMIATFGPGTDSGITRQAPGPKPPINLTIDALRTALVRALIDAENVLRAAEELSQPSAAPVRELYAVSRAVTIIAPRVPVLAALPTGRRHLTRLTRLHRTIGDVTGRTPVTTRLPGDCPRCARRDLRRDGGADTVYCFCGWRTTPAEYRAYVRLHIDAAGVTRPGD